MRVTHWGNRVDLQSGETLRAIELFAGAGGLGMGVSKAGFSHDLVVEWDQYACDTIRKNQKRNINPVGNWPEVSQTDVRAIDFTQFNGKLDLVAGGPPCQPFSMGGKRRGPMDHRDMFPQAVRAVRESAPRAFLFENVKGLLRPSLGNYFTYIVLQLTYPDFVQNPGERWEDHYSRLEKYHTSGIRDGLYYRVVYRVLNAANYGVPQKRERVFIVGFRSDLGLEWSFPQATHSEDALKYSKWVTGDYWEKHELPNKKFAGVPRGLKTYIEKSKRSKIKPNLKPWRTVRDAIRGLPEPGENYTNIFNHLPTNPSKSYPGHTGSPLDEPAKTLKAGAHGVPGGENTLVYPNGRMRYFTVRESARLQTFPDNYQFHGSWGECMRQLGNAVPVILGLTVAKSVREKLDNLDNKKIVKFRSGKTA